MMKKPSLTSMLKLSLGSHSIEDMTPGPALLFCAACKLCERLLRYVETGTRCCCGGGGGQEEEDDDDEYCGSDDSNRQPKRQTNAKPRAALCTSCARRSAAPLGTTRPQLLPLVVGLGLQTFPADVRCLLWRSWLRRAWPFIFERGIWNRRGRACGWCCSAKLKSLSRWDNGGCYTQRGCFFVLSVAALTDLLLFFFLFCFLLLSFFCCCCLFSSSR